MPAAIKRILTKTGTLYEVKAPWPGVEQDEVPDTDKLRVAMITYFPEDSDGDDDNGSATNPARYELWCLNDRVRTFIESDLKGETSQDEAQYVQSLPNIMCRTIFASEVALVDEEWDMGDALLQYAQRLLDWGSSALEDHEQLQAGLKESIERMQELQQKQNGQTEQAATPAPAPA